MSTFDPGQREHELTEALLRLLLAVSRFCGEADCPTPTDERLAFLARLSELLAAAVAERARLLRGTQAERGAERRGAAR